MSGTKEGGKKATKANMERHGANYYRNIGRLGGSKSHPDTRPFTVNTELAKIAGAKGGRISRRGKAKKTLNKETAEEASMKGLIKILSKLGRK